MLSTEEASPSSLPSNTHLGIDVSGVDKKESVGSCGDSSVGPFRTSHDSKRYDESEQSPRKVRQSSWTMPKRKRGMLSASSSDMAVAMAVVYTGLFVIVLVAAGLSYVSSVDEKSTWHFILSGLLGASALFYWVSSLTRSGLLSLKAISFCSIVTAFLTAFAAQVAYEDTPAVIGQIQAVLLLLPFLNNNHKEALWMLAVNAASWVFGWVFHTHSLFAALTPTLLIAFMSFLVLVHPYFRFSAHEQLSGSDVLEHLNQSDVEVRPVESHSLYRIEAEKERLHSELSSASAGIPQKKPSISSSDTAFFVAPLETINYRLNAVCRASVDGLVRGDDDEVSIARSSSIANTVGKPPLRPSSSVVRLATDTEGSPTGSRPTRSYSLSSHQSLASDKSSSSHVSFVPTLKRTTDGHGTSFASPVLKQSEEEEELDDAESLAHTVSRSSSEDIVSSELKQHMTPSKKSVPKKSLPIATKRYNSILKGRPGTRSGNSLQASPTNAAPVPGAVPTSPLSFYSLGKSEDESKKDAAEAMELVKSVVQLDFSATIPQNHPLAGGMKIPLQNLSSTTLQKLVVLFTRLSEELDTYRIQRFICACVVQVLQCERASIFLCDWNKQHIWTISDEGHQIKVPMAGSLAGYAALNNRVLNIKDAYKDARFNKDVDKNTGYVTRNLLVYPISRGINYTGSGNVIAVVEAINKVGGTFTAEDEGVLALLGKQAGIHLSNAQVYQQLQVEGNKTNSLLEVSKEINDVQLDIGAMMSKIMARARQVLTVERASIFLVDDHKRELWSILTDSETAAQIGGDNVIRLPVGVGLAGHVAVTGNVLNIPDAYACELFNPEFDRKTGFVTKATLCVPVKPQHSNKVMGVIQFINKCNGEAFHDSDVELALSFSSFVGISLNNILLYDELREGQVLREKNKELVRLRDQAKQAAEAKSNFLMAMSHEIRTPMSGVIGMCELLMNTKLSSEQKEMGETIKSCGEALMAIINDILDYGRLDAGKLELEKRPFFLVNILEETIDVIRPKTENKKIALMVDVDPQVTTELVGDVYRLRQILTNLLGNAVKFTPDGGDVTLLVKLSESNAKSISVYFSVTDTGIGIAPGAQQKLFKPFEQADAGTTRQYGGSGLGLTICKQLVEAMEGEIGIESAQGKGSTFWCTAVFGRPATSVETVSECLNNIAGEVKGSRLALFGCSHTVHRGVLLRLLSFLKVHSLFVTSYQELSALLKADDGQTVTYKAGTSERAPQPGFKIPELLMIDEGLTGLGEDELKELVTYCKSSQKKLVMLMSMKSKSATVYKEDYALILTMPPKLALVAGVLNNNEGNMLNASSGTEDVIQNSAAASTKKILVAEDNTTNQLLIKKQLAGFDIIPRIVENGQEAVNALSEERYDLIFMDCHMPVLDGYGAVKQIREKERTGELWPNQPPITIVALTADALPHTKGLCVAAGMNDYITKPLRRVTLKETLDKYYFRTL
eukprot:TRINITY_DN30362_c0_g1_i1.p1 TRINITY_DN30362_c0_g1~~TRINITY_DN30362_c0_g1_i1.p1  ORF type:complete len:1469 (+),score=327.89 TRINITY_DN30362_c0_g1_i1:49-4455(+)